MDIHTKVHGFTLQRKTFIRETDSTAYLFTHEKSGARLFFLENDDDNKVFSIAFRTPPIDDTGVAHIVEHSVLCGSRKYPLKEPFVELVKGSLNTFLNAMTYPDKTMYPVASRNDKDFQNLMDVYLDAVFYPNMKRDPHILMQEGWHYEIGNADSPLTYSGVVYNEMKGALSSPDDILESRIMTSLYPDTTYGYESGGDPEAIPNLTQAMFASFHDRYYHPSNSYIYLYGDLDIEEKLAYLDAEYLSHFDRIPVPSHIKEQKPFAVMKRSRSSYPIGAEESVRGKTFLSMNWIVGKSLDLKDMMGLEILEHAILRTQAAPLRKALLRAKIGKDVDSIFENDILQPFFSIIVNNTEESCVDAFCETVEKTLATLAEKGLDRTLMKASINLFEFRLREADFGSAPRGLVYAIRVMKSWLYDGDPEAPLYYEDALQQMKDGLETGYFEELIRRYLLDNTHRTLVVLRPDAELAVRREARQAEILANKKAAMSKAEIAAYVEETRALKTRQQTPDSEEALNTIPILSLKDIRREAYDLPLEEREIDTVKVLLSNVETNGIAYVNLFFDAQTVPQDKLLYLYLLSDLIGSVDTEVRGYADVANQQNLVTGGIRFDLAGFSRKGKPDSLAPKFCVRMKVLTKKLSDGFALVEELLTKSRFTDEKRIRERIEQEATSIELSLQRSANQIIATRISSYFTRVGAYSSTGELPFYHFLKDFQANFAENHAKMQRIFAELLPLVFNRNNLLVGLTIDGKDYGAFEAPFEKLLSALSEEKFPAQMYPWDLMAKSEGLTSSSRVQYVGKGANFIRLGYEYSGSMLVLSTLLRYDYFWTKIRVQGGAYGAFTNFNRNGMLFFGSYRDPHLTQTIDVFNATGDYVRRFDATKREMDKFIIGTMSSLDAPMTPKMKGETAMGCYLHGVTFDDRQKTRDEVLATRQEDIRALAPLVDSCMRENALCVFGGEEKIHAARGVFDMVKPAL